MVGEEIFSTIKLCIRPRKKVEFLLDIVFWVLISLIFSSFLYYASYGKVSVHSFIGFFAGLILWRACFYGTIKDKFKGKKTMKQFSGDMYYHDETKEKTKSSVQG